MARGEVTGKKPRATADRPERKPGAPRADPDAIEPTRHDEPNSNASAKATPIRGPPVPPAVYTIATFCVAHAISEAFFHKLRGLGLGPQLTRVGSRVFITFESAARWRAEREAATTAAE